MSPRAARHSLTHPFSPHPYLTFEGILTSPQQWISGSQGPWFHTSGSLSLQDRILGTHVPQVPPWALLLLEVRGHTPPQIFWTQG